MTERYFICLNCGELTTWTQIMAECSSGGMGMCDCDFCDLQWDTKYNGFEPVYFRIYNEYIEIPKIVYEGLLGEKNCVLRLKMYNTVPKEVLEVKK